MTISTKTIYYFIVIFSCPITHGSETPLPLLREDILAAYAGIVSSSACSHSTWSSSSSSSRLPLPLARLFFLRESAATILYSQKNCSTWMAYSV